MALRDIHADKIFYNNLICTNTDSIDHCVNRCCRLTYTAPNVNTAKDDLKKTLQLNVRMVTGRIPLLTNERINWDHLRIEVFYTIEIKEDNKISTQATFDGTPYNLFLNLANNINDKFKSLTLDGFRIGYCTNEECILNKFSVQTIKTLFPELETYFKDLRVTHDTQKEKEEREEQRNLLIEILAKLSWNEDKMRSMPKEQTGSLDLI